MAHVTYVDIDRLKIHPLVAANRCIGPELAAAHVQEFVELLESGLPYPGKVSPLALFDDAAIVREEMVDVVKKHCAARGAIAEIDCDGRGNWWFHTLVLADSVWERGVAKQFKKGKASKKEPKLVYFIRAEGTNLVKIGRARDVQERIRTMQTTSASKLILLATIPESVFSEPHLHRKFKHLRNHSEWFRCTKELADFINSIARKDS